jgi:hypothetical protein
MLLQETRKSLDPVRAVKESAEKDMTEKKDGEMTEKPQDNGKRESEHPVFARYHVIESLRCHGNFL